MRVWNRNMHMFVGLVPTKPLNCCGQFPMCLLVKTFCMFWATWSLSACNNVVVRIMWHGLWNWEFEYLKANQSICYYNLRLEVGSIACSTALVLNIGSCVLCNEKTEMRLCSCSDPHHSKMWMIESYCEELGRSWSSCPLETVTFCYEVLGDELIILQAFEIPIRCAMIMAI